MARKRVESEPALRSWQAVDDALRDIRECRHALTELSVEQARRIDAVKEECKSSALPLQNRIKRLESDVKEYVDAHRAELAGKSRTLTFGTVGYRRSSQLKLNLSVEDTIALLEALGHSEFIRVTKTLDRDALRRQSTEFLWQIDAWINTTDGFSYDVTDEMPEV
ncbi:MAG: hypothetical protein HDT27_02030 [Subdoligranulum sp.]|nr:hypothetical protein [Subdoligranulum sp.]